MKFTDRFHNEVVIVEMSGRILGGRDTTMFLGRVHEYINLNKKHFIIDMNGVDRINSVGLGMLTSAIVSIRKAGGDMVLANITSIESILSITRLTSVFDSYDSLELAIKKFPKTEVTI